MPNPRQQPTAAQLKQALAAQDYEGSVVDPPLPDGRIPVQANKLQPVTAPNGQTLYVLLPVTLHVTLDGRGAIQRIDGGEPEPKAVDSAAQWLKTLIDNGQLAGFDKTPTPDATHSIEEDAGPAHCAAPALFRILSSLAMATYGTMRPCRHKVSHLLGSSPCTLWCTHNA